MTTLTRIRNKNCTRCPLHENAITVCVIGRGDPSASIMIVGEAPGAEEDEQGIPFVGRSGKKLDAALKAAGFNMDDLYITNAVKCRPPENAKPTQAEEAACRIYLINEIWKLKPKLIITLGNHALRQVTGQWGITKLRGTVTHTKLGGHGKIPVWPTFHPSYILHNPSAWDEWIFDLTTAAETWREFNE